MWLSCWPQHWDSASSSCKWLESEHGWQETLNISTLQAPSKLPSVTSGILLKCTVSPQADTERCMHTSITSRLDYCNALLSGLPKKALNNLQIFQSAAARALTKTKRTAHMSPVLKSLHWLPVSFRIDFKIILLVFKSLNGLAPEYLWDTPLMYVPSRCLLFPLL